MWRDLRCEDRYDELAPATDHIAPADDRCYQQRQEREDHDVARRQRLQDIPHRQRDGVSEARHPHQLIECEQREREELRC